jgi:2-dehydropantoate 2-reductase
MEIKRVSIIGLGALGILFGNCLSKKMTSDNLKFIADRSRIEKYEKKHVYCNGEHCEFNYVTPEDICEPADLIIFAVKYSSLTEAMQAVKNQVGEHTIILSALNGITSEAIIGEVYGMDKILYCVAQGMDAVKEGNELTYHNMGMLCIGEREPGLVSQKVKRVSEFFEKMGVPYEVDTDMYKRQWGKFMLNVGVNQTVAVYESDYGEIQTGGEARNTVISAMREVIALSEKAGINLTVTDMNYWLKILGTLNPKGKPSMRQDMEARRYSEVELFAGEVLKMGKIYDISTPVNKMLYDRIKFIENKY